MTAIKLPMVGQVRVGKELELETESAGTPLWIAALYLSTFRESEVVGVKPGRKLVFPLPRGSHVPLAFLPLSSGSSLDSKNPHTLHVGYSRHRFVILHGFPRHFRSHPPHVMRSAL